MVSFEKDVENVIHFRKAAAWLSFLVFVAITSLPELYLCTGLDVLAYVCLCRDGGKPADTFLGPVLL